MERTIFLGKEKDTVRKRGRKLTYKEENQDIEGTVGACDWRDPET